MRRTAVGAALLLFLATGPLSATTFPPSTTADLVRRAERVCCSRCERIEARVEPKTGIVFTFVTLRLLEDLKGAGEGGEIRLRIAGGRVGNVATVVPGMPRFKPGEESVVFLGRKNRAGHPVVVDAERGVVSLRKDERGRRHLARRVTGFEELRSKRRISLDQFRTAVRKVVAEEKSRKERKGR